MGCPPQTRRVRRDLYRIAVCIWAAPAGARGGVFEVRGLGLGPGFSGWGCGRGWG